MQKSKLQFKIQNYFFAVLIMVLLPLAVSAASLNLVSPVSEIGVGQKFYVDLVIDAEGQDINAAQGTINFPADILKFDSLSDGDSVITFWAEKPAYKNGAVSFSGVIPGGFNGVLSPYYVGVKPGKILRLYFVAKTSGDASVKVTDTQVLLNDGKGTEASTRISNLEFRILKSEGQIPDSKFQIPADTESPEDFKPQITSDSNLFNGKNTLVWIAKDKGSGIDHYEVAEQRGNITQDYTKLPWQTAESPYVLKDQDLKSYVYVKAVDRAGNFRVVYLSPSYIPWYKKPLVDIIVGLFGLAVLLLVVKWLWRKLKYRIIH